MKIAKPISLGTIRTSRNPRLVRQLNQALDVSAFSTTIEEWPGASYIVARGVVQVGSIWSFVVPVTKPSTSFVACIKWTEAGSVVRRYKLWENVGELLSYPLYNGELIPAADVILEVWCVNGSLTASITSNWQPIIAKLDIPENCCSVNNTLYALDALCLTNEPPIVDNYLNNLDDYFGHCPLP